MVLKYFKILHEGKWLTGSRQCEYDLKEKAHTISCKYESHKKRKRNLNLKIKKMLGGIFIFMLS